jgi:hypothetical protein
MNPTLTTVLVLLGSIFLVIWILVRVHDRDQKKEALKNQGDQSV